jgi:hypothetical protein
LRSPITHLHELGEIGLFNVQEICARTRVLGLGDKVMNHRVERRFPAR